MTSPTNFFEICLKWPPSVNTMYTIVRGRKILTNEARAYKRYVQFKIAKEYPVRIDGINKTSIYGVTYLLYREDWLNKGYPKKAKTKFKRVDLDNPIKCVQDAVMGAIGVEDSQIFEIWVKKCKGAKKIVMQLQLLTEPS